MTREEWTHPKGLFPGVMDFDRESLVGQVIGRAIQHDNTTMRFYLTCSIGELAQRIVLALDPELATKVRPIQPTESWPRV